LNNFQRIGSKSNAHVGSRFEEIAQQYFKSENIVLDRGYRLNIGVNKKKKGHVFDLGCNCDDYGKIIVECKSHK
jgi:hypothetical protein